MLVLKLKRGNELKERKTKVKTKVWKDVDEVVKATIEVPKRVQWLVEVMEELKALMQLKAMRKLMNAAIILQGQMGLDYLQKLTLKTT